MASLNNLDLNLLKALDALLKERSVTRAAARLGLTQPAVSAMLGRLRYYFNDPILIRTAHGMIPTSRALSMAEPLKRILGELELLIQPIEFDPKNLEMILSIGSTDNGFRSLGIPFVLRLQQLAPKVKVSFLTLQNCNMEVMLENGKLDFVIISYLAVPEHLRFKLLYKERYVCVMRSNHPVLQQEWNLKKFCEQDFVLGSFYGGGFFGATDKALQKLGCKRNVILSVQNFAIIPELLRQSDLVAVVPRHLIQPDDGVVLKDIPIEVEGYEKIIAWHERNHTNTAQQWFRQLLINVAEERK